MTKLYKSDNAIVFVEIIVYDRFYWKQYAGEFTSEGIKCPPVKRVIKLLCENTSMTFDCAPAIFGNTILETLSNWNVYYNNTFISQEMFIIIDKKVKTCIVYKNIVKMLDDSNNKLKIIW